MPLLSSLLSLNFLYSVLLVAISVGLALVIEKKNEHKKAILFVLGGYCIGGTISLFLFGLADFLVPAIIAAIAIPFGMGFLTKKELEYEFMPIPRSAAYSAEKIIFITTAGFFFYLLILGYSDSKTLEKNFVPEMLGMTTGSNISISDSMNLQLAELVSQSKTQVVDQIIAESEMQEMVSKQYYEALVLNEKLKAYKKAYAAPEFKAQITDALKNQKIDLGGELLSKFPLIGFFSKIAWILYAVSGLFFCAIIGNVLVKNIAAVIYSTIIRVME
jgi:hypothetical protein